MTVRRLLVARHAATAPYAPEGDPARPLLPAGSEQARSAGAALADRGLVPDLALVSSALRTQQTWAGVSAGLGTQPQAWTEDRIYQNDPGVLLAVLADVPDEVSTVLLIGHAPAVPALAYDLTAPGDGERDRELLASLVERFEPMTIADLSLPAAVTWSDLVPASATLNAIHRPPPAT